MANRAALTITAVAVAFAIGVAATIAVIAFQRPSVEIASGSTWYSHIKDQRLAVLVSDSDLGSSPSWTPSAPLPLRPEDAIQLAQEALTTMAPSMRAWTFSELALRQETPGHYFFTVTFRPNELAHGHEFVQFVVYFNGKVGIPSVSK